SRKDGDGDTSFQLKSDSLCDTPIKSQRSGIPLWGATS
ncbi:hypothetical protein Tco_0470085, partial [Tanacetum coccineum]